MCFTHRGQGRSRLLQVRFAAAAQGSLWPEAGVATPRLGTSAVEVTPDMPFTGLIGRHELNRNRAAIFALTSISSVAGIWHDSRQDEFGSAEDQGRNSIDNFGMLEAGSLSQ
jgi:hypothetical protein